MLFFAVERHFPQCCEKSQVGHFASRVFTFRLNAPQPGSSVNQNQLNCICEFADLLKCVCNPDVSICHWGACACAGAAGAVVVGAALRAWPQLAWVEGRFCSCFQSLGAAARGSSRGAVRAAWVLGPFLLKLAYFVK